MIAGKKTSEQVSDEIAIANECAKIIDQVSNSRELTDALKNRSLAVKQMLLKLYEYRQSTGFCEVLRISIRESKRGK